ncbi:MULTISPECIES: divalent metal cation transporter [Paenibacillus]|nr:MULTISPECIES: divalent metal cation transporter [Paenibacillus]
MHGFVRFTIPGWLRRVISMLPAVIIVSLGLDPTRTLVISQVALSLILTTPVITLIYFTRRKDLIGI